MCYPCPLSWCVVHDALELRGCTAASRAATSRRAAPPVPVASCTAVLPAPHRAVVSGSLFYLPPVASTVSLSAPKAAVDHYVEHLAA